MKAIRLGLAVCFVLMCASCSLKTNWDMVGKWESAQGKEVIEFNKNGTVNYVGEGISMTAGYKFTDPKHLQISMGSLGSLVKKVSVSGGTLTLTDSDGKVSEFTKIK